MDPAILASVGQLGLGGIVFYIWWNDYKRIEGLLGVINEQIDDKQQMREERAELIAVIRNQSVLIERSTNLLARVESRLPKAGHGTLSA
jgi:hypothetical protein